MRKVIAIIISISMILQLSACNIKENASSLVDSAKESGEKAFDTVSEWYSNLDFSKFKDGWDYSIEFMGSQYAAAMSSEYVSNIEAALTTLETDINASVGSARGTAQEAGYLAEKWASDTFNLDAVANGSKYRAEVFGSNEFASVDVKTNYGENASLKYYQDANGSASAQAKTLLKAYKEYCSETKKSEPQSLSEYMSERGYDPNSQDALLASIYKDQTRIIPTDQLEEAKNYLQGRINKLSKIEGEVASGRKQAYQETLDNLKDRLEAPDGTESKPLSRDEAQAIAELAKDGEFKPEKFKVTLSSVISPKYVVKQAMGTGIETAAISTVFTVGPDIYSILKEASKTGDLDEDKLKETGVEGAVAASGGFVEGSVSRVVTTLCKSGVWGDALKEANPSVVAALTVLIIEGAIHGFELSQGKITTEEYGNMMIDRFMISMMGIPTSALFLAILPASKICMMAGCMAGGMLACIGYMVAKNAVMDIVDGGGFEAIIPADSASSFSVAKNAIASLNVKDQISSFADSAITTANDGLIKVKSIVD